MLAELIERTSGVPYTSFVAERVLAPLGLERLQLGVPLDEQADICELSKVGELVSADELEKAIGIRSLPVTDVTAEALLQFNRPDVRAVGVPGGGGVSTRPTSRGSTKRSSRARRPCSRPTRSTSSPCTSAII